MKHKLMLSVLLSLGFICPNVYAQQSSDPAKWHDEGIYYYNKSEPSNLFIQIDPTDPSGTKTGGFGSALGQAYTGGISKANVQTIISGAYSKRQIHHNSPRFYFYFKADDISPNQFVLVRFNEKKHDRTMVTGSSNAYGSTTGISDKQKVDFTYEKLSGGIFKVYAQAPLEEGEYCFIYVGKAESPFAEHVYDFGISLQ